MLQPREELQIVLFADHADDPGPDLFVADEPLRLHQRLAKTKIVDNAFEMAGNAPERREVYRLSVALDAALRVPSRRRRSLIICVVQMRVGRRNLHARVERLRAIIHNREVSALERSPFRRHRDRLNLVRPDA